MCVAEGQNDPCDKSYSNIQVYDANAVWKAKEKKVPRLTLLFAFSPVAHVWPQSNI